MMMVGIRHLMQGIHPTNAIPYFQPEGLNCVYVYDHVKLKGKAKQKQFVKRHEDIHMSTRGMALAKVSAGGLQDVSHFKRDKNLIIFNSKGDFIMVLLLTRLLAFPS